MIPTVTVIVPHHLNENDQYLRWCIKSIVSSKNIRLEVICVSDATENPIYSANLWELSDIPDRKLTCYHDPGLSNVTKKWRFGLSVSNPESEYVMLISDDVMVSEHTIAMLAASAEGAPMILNPASNGDASTRYYASYGLRKGTEFKDIPHKCTLEEISGFEESVISMPLMNPVIIDPGWVSFYCTLFPRTVLNQVGDFDEKLDVRYNDVDYCKRARALGIPSLIQLGCFALHFGDRTLPKCTTEAEYHAADVAWQEKYHPIPQDDGDLL